MTTIVNMLRNMWGGRAPLVAEEYLAVAKDNALFMADLAIFCNAATPVQGTNEFDRGVEEGKRRVWLHISRMAAISADDFVPIANGDRVLTRS